jgi:Spy/CpxP family protein refolding chaperone
MRTHRLLAGLLVLVLGTGGLLLGQDKKPGDKEAPTKYKGQLPAGWKKLGLSEEQVQKVYKVQHDFRARIEALEEQIDALKRQRQAEMEKVLTAAQKARLKELKEVKDEPARGSDKKDDPRKKPGDSK